MSILVGMAIGALALVGVVGSLLLRSWLLARQRGTMSMYLRTTTLFAGRGWSPGLARYAGDRLRWHRLFSLGIRPKRTLTRAGLAVESRRAPTGPEQLSLPGDWVVLRCTSYHAPVEIALAPAAVSGFFTWLEAAPPGTASLRSLPVPPPAPNDRRG